MNREIEQEFATLKSQVLSVLHDTPEARNSDVTLQLEVWRRYYGQYIDDAGKIALSALFLLPRSETIQRRRQECQELGQYLPTDPAVQKERAARSVKMRRALGYPTPFPVDETGQVRFG